MAKKITRPLAPPAPPPPPENEIEVLHPEREVKLRGRVVTVREFGHVEWLRLLPRAEPLVAAIAEALERGRDPTYEEALACLAQNIDALVPLIEQAAGIDSEFHQSLKPDEGENLLMIWWAVNGRFFVSRAMSRVAIARQERANQAALRKLVESATPNSAPA